MILITNEYGEKIKARKIKLRNVPFHDFNCARFIFVNGKPKLLLSNRDGTKGYLKFNDSWLVMDYDYETYPDGLEPILGKSNYLTFQEVLKNDKSF